MGFAAASFPAVAPNASKLPYDVRLKGWPLAWAVIANGLGVAFAAFAAVVSIDPAPTRWTHPWLFDIPLFAVAALCGLRLWRLKDPEIQLFPDRLVRPGLIGSRELYRSDIAGVSKTISSRYGSYFYIAPRPGHGERFSLPASLRQDPVLAEWLSGAPDPAAVARAADRASVLADDRYGASERERAARLVLANRVIIGFSVACTAAAAWIGFFDPPALLSLGVAGACLVAAYALVVVFQGLVVWLPSGGVRPSPLAALIPAAALSLRGILTIHLLTTDPLMIAAAVVGAGTALAAHQWRSPSTSPLGFPLAAGGLAAVFAYGAGAYLDALSTKSPVGSYVVTLEDKSVSHGRSTTYYLDLAPWGDQPARSVQVSSALYDQVDVGSNICIDRYRGDLGVPWFDVGKCLKPTLKTRDEYLRSGEALINTGRYAAALKDLAQAASLDPGSEAAWGQLAMVHAWSGDTKSAGAEAAKAAALDPGGAYVLRVKGFVAEVAGRRQEALADFSKAIAMDPKDAFSREHRADVEVLVGSYQAALADAEAVIAAYPHDLFAPVVEARAYLGLNRLDDVRRIADRLAPASRDQNVLLTRAHILVIGEDRAAALATLGRAIALAPSASAYAYRAQLLALSDPRAARADAEAALKLAPGWPPAVALIRGLDQRGQDEAADPAPGQPRRNQISGQGGRS